MAKGVQITTRQMATGDRQVCVVAVAGYLDAHTCRQLEEQLLALIEAEQYNLLLDFGSLDYISSAGLGVLVDVHRQAGDHGGALKIAAVSDNIRGIFEILGFTKLMELHSGVQSALASFSTERKAQ